MLPGPPGWEDLFRYESTVNRAVVRMPALLICLYDLRKFGADMLVEVLHTHPRVLLDRTVIDNPHYVDPAEYAPPADLGATSRYALVKAGAGGGHGTDGWASLTGAELRITSGVARG